MAGFALVDPGMQQPNLQLQYGCQCFRAPCNCAAAVPGGPLGNLDTTQPSGEVRHVMTAEDWAKLGLLGNTVAQQWSVLAHPGTSLPAPAPGGEVNVPGFRASFNTNLLVIVGGGIVLLLLLSK
jgi:hypothetical protein